MARHQSVSRPLFLKKLSPPSVFVRIFLNLAHMFPGLVTTKVLAHFLRFLPVGPETGKNGPI